MKSGGRLPSLSTGGTGKETPATGAKGSCSQPGQGQLSPGLKKRVLTSFLFPTESHNPKFPLCPERPSSCRGPGEGRVPLPIPVPRDCSPPGCPKRASPLRAAVTACRGAEPNQGQPLHVCACVYTPAVAVPPGRCRQSCFFTPGISCRCFFLSHKAQNQCRVLELGLSWPAAATQRTLKHTHGCLDEALRSCLSSAFFSLFFFLPKEAAFLVKRQDP